MKVNQEVLVKTRQRMQFDPTIFRTGPNWFVHQISVEVEVPVVSTESQLD